MDLQRTVYLQRRGAHDIVPLVSIQRPVAGATIADFGLSIVEGRMLLVALQQVVAQEQIRTYGTDRRCCTHATVRKETIRCGEYIEDEPFREGWFADDRACDGEKHLRVAIDRTVLTALPPEDVSKFEVIAARVERDGRMRHRFLCALQPPRRLGCSSPPSSINAAGCPRQRSMW
ncbi:hypothetical protein SAMN05446635_0603 [Burkholderia sp. OK233]|nr:hypothetical protein SAMN05446635_0603 [Burkholderia sp. OK233]